MADNKSIEKQEITRKLYSRGRSSGTFKFTDAKQIDPIQFFEEIDKNHDTIRIEWYPEQVYWKRCSVYGSPAQSDSEQDSDD